MRKTESARMTASILVLVLLPILDGCSSRQKNQNSSEKSIEANNLTTSSVTNHTAESEVELDKKNGEEELYANKDVAKMSSVLKISLPVDIQRTMMFSDGGSMVIEFVDSRTSVHRVSLDGKFCSPDAGTIYLDKKKLEKESDELKELFEILLDGAKEGKQKQSVLYLRDKSAEEKWPCPE